nr:hypothetical protein [Tanacetum cinerariifolium]
FNKTTDAVIEEVPEVLAMEESSGNDLETNISVSNNDVTLSQSDDLFITVSSSSTMSEDHSSGADEIDSDKSAIEEIKEKPELIEEEESAGNDLEANISVTDNDVASSPSSDLLIAVLSPSTLA